MRDQLLQRIARFSLEFTHIAINQTRHNPPQANANRPEVSFCICFSNVSFLLRMCIIYGIYGIHCDAVRIQERIDCSFTIILDHLLTISHLAIDACPAKIPINIYSSILHGSNLYNLSRRNLFFTPTH